MGRLPNALTSSYEQVFTREYLMHCAQTVLAGLAL